MRRYHPCGVSESHGEPLRARPLHSSPSLHHHGQVVGGHPFRTSLWHVSWKRRLRHPSRRATGGLGPSLCVCIREWSWLGSLRLILKVSRSRLREKVELPSLWPRLEGNNGNHIKPPL